MRFTKLAVLGALAVVLLPAGATGQERRPQGTVLAASIDQRLVVTRAEQRAAVAGANRDVPLRADGWNLYGATEYMMWGMLAGGVVGVAVGAATSRKDLTGPVGIIMGGIFGIGAGGGLGVALYTVQKL